MSDPVTVVLKTDPILGLFANVDEAEAEGLRAFLVESGIRFAFDQESGVRLAEPGKRTFVFGAQHPHVIRQMILDYELEVEIDPVVQLTEYSYRPPVDQLLKLGEARRHEPVAKFSSLGIRAEDVPELIRMVTDEELHGGPSDSKIIYAPVHAWWALAELRAEEAIAPLLGLLRFIDEDHDDWVGEDLPRVFAQFGTSAVSPVAEYLANPAHGEWARVSAAVSLGKIAHTHPEMRAECIARLTAQLEQFAGQSETLNAFLMSPLLDLHAVEAAPLLEKVFAAGCVDESVNGDWEDLQIELGLKTQREHPRKPNKLTMMFDPIRRELGLPASDVAFDTSQTELSSPKPYIAPPKIGRNEPCPCGSGNKYKKCCGR